MQQVSLCLCCSLRNDWISNYLWSLIPPPRTHASPLTYAFSNLSKAVRRSHSSDRLLLLLQNVYWEEYFMDIKANIFFCGWNTQYLYFHVVFHQANANETKLKKSSRALQSHCSKQSSYPSIHYPLSALVQHKFLAQLGTSHIHKKNHITNGWQM